MESLPAAKTPLKGSEGHKYRTKQLIQQLPAHDTDSSLCDNLTENEKHQMDEFLQQQQQNVVGRASVKSHKPERDASTWVGNNDLYMHSFVKTVVLNFQHCAKCLESVVVGSCAVFAEKAGDRVCWHPKCFVCYQCEELLVDLIYFWKDGKLYCGRHHAELVKPRCAACDEVIVTIPMCEILTCKVSK